MAAHVIIRLFLLAGVAALFVGSLGGLALLNRDRHRGRREFPRVRA